jgi:uncharacterized protein YgiM (DUF1202 family)
MKRPTIGLLLSFLSLTLPITAISLPAHAVEETSSATRYLSAEQAKLFSEPKFTAKTLQQLNKGAKLQVLQQKGAWVQVKAGNQQGWVSKFVLSKTPPLERVTVLPGNKEVKLKDVRRRTSAITTAAAARGLADVSRGTKKDRYVSNPEGVRYMESIKIDEAELARFAKPLNAGGQ